MRMIKFGDLYLTEQGTLSPFQRDALRLGDDALILSDAPRLVRLRPNSRMSANAANHTPVDPREPDPRD